jgi:hypothetical protein
MKFSLKCGRAVAIGALLASGAFAPESLATLVDSTVLIARKVRTIELGGQPPVFLHLAADTDAASNMPAEMVGHYRALVAEAQALFGGSHRMRCLRPSARFNPTSNVG